MAEREAAGIRLKALPNGRLEVVPASKLTDELLALLKANKTELWESLSHQRVTESWTRFRAEAASIMSLDTWEARKEALSKYREEHGDLAAREMWLWLVHHYGEPTVMDS